MEETKVKTLIEVENRKSCKLEGVKKVEGFDDKEFLVDTEDGFLHIKGKTLSLGNMNMDEGKLTILGEIDSIGYVNRSKEKEVGFLKKLFK